jgi:hypothetical protein
MVRAFALALALATAVCGVKGNPRPPLLPGAPDGGAELVDAGSAADAGTAGADGGGP